MLTLIISNYQRFYFRSRYESKIKAAIKRLQPFVLYARRSAQRNASSIVINIYPPASTSIGSAEIVVKLHHHPYYFSITFL